MAIKQPTVSRKGKWSIALVGSILLMGAMLGVWLMSLVQHQYAQHRLSGNLNNVTVLADQRAAALGNAGELTLGSPAASVASGKAALPPIVFVATVSTET